MACDDAGLAERIARSVADPSRRVEICPDKEALPTALASWDPDVLILDQHLAPDAWTLELCGELASNGATDPCRVLILTHQAAPD